MNIARGLLDGTVMDPAQILPNLRDVMIPQVVTRMNMHLPAEVALFPNDELPTNQRNLTDYRTRIGTLLEYTFARSVNELLPYHLKQAGLRLTNVVANKFPDLAFRSLNGQIGIRFEMKAIQTVAEEKAANFDTLIKDIRKGTDFIAVLLWDWKPDVNGNCQYPHIEACYVMDAYELAQIRDNNWLNTPPSGLVSARQGFDLRYGINASGNNYNQEEGNYGKLMRISDTAQEVHLPRALKESDTLRTYGELRSESVRLGLENVCRSIATEGAEPNARTHRLVSRALPVCFLVEEGTNRLLVMGDRSRPKKGPTTAMMRAHNAGQAMVMSEKFTWAVLDYRGQRITSGSKPGEAGRWAREHWHPNPPNRLI